VGDPFPFIVNGAIVFIAGLTYGSFNGHIDIYKNTFEGSVIRHFLKIIINKDTT
jgi:hypothetical protein